MNSNTGVDWRTFYREVCESALGEQKVTGEERILVEIGEKHSGRRWIHLSCSHKVAMKQLLLVDAPHVPSEVRTDVLT